MTLGNWTSCACAPYASPSPISLAMCNKTVYNKKNGSVDL